MVMRGRKPQGQSHVHQIILIEVASHKTSCFWKSSVYAKVDGWKALSGLSIDYYISRSCPTILLEPVALRAVNGVRGREPFCY